MKTLALMTLVLMSVDLLSQQTDAQFANLKKYQRENSALKPPGAKEKRVVFMGNSITEYWKVVDEGFFKNKPYVNRGISGQTTPQMVLRFKSDVVNLKPAAVVILAGINDIAENTGPIPVDSTFRNIVKMAEMAQQAKIKVILCSVLPAFEFEWRPNIRPIEKIIQLNTMIKTYAAEHKLAYVDYYSAMVDERKGLNPKYSKDGVHPNLAGYMVMGPIVEKAIVKTVKKK